MKLGIVNFAGERPVIAPELLPDNASTNTLNARPEGGSLVPIKEMVNTGEVLANNVVSWAPHPSDQTKSMTRTDMASFVRGPLANDSYDRVYCGGFDLSPEVFYLNAGSLVRKKLGINKPPTPSVSSGSQTQEPPTPDFILVRCVYYITYVTALGEESEPSDPTAVAQRWDGSGGAVTLTIPSVTDSRAEKMRLYRSEAGGVYNYVQDISLGVTSFSDSIYTKSLGAPCSSENFTHPPERLKGLMAAGNGFMAAYDGNTLFFSEPYSPHAWPVEYQLSFFENITGIAVIGGSILVTTKTNPWFVTGSHPSAMSQSRVDITAPCTSPHGIADMGEYALYPSNEGLVFAVPGDVRIATREFFSKDQWKSYLPETFKSFRYREQYLCFGNGRCFIFDLNRGFYPIELTTTAGEMLENGFYQASTDTLYLVVAGAGGSKALYKFDSGVNREMSWSSRQFKIKSGVVFTCARIDCRGNALLELSDANGVYNFVKTVISDEGFRVKSGRPDRLVVTIKSNERIDSLSMASTMRELL